MTDHLILITCWGPRACTQSSAVLLSHSVAKYYSLLAYTWIRLKINPQVPGSVSNRHGIECGPKLTKAVGQKWRFRAKVTHCTFDNTHIFTTTHTHTSHADVTSILVLFDFLQKEGALESKLPTETCKQAAHLCINSILQKRCVKKGQRLTLALPLHLRSFATRHKTLDTFLKPRW